MATATTSIVPMPKATKIGLPANSSPAIAVSTVRPEMSTARPEVAAAISTAACDRVAAVALLHHPARVEHRVVHADGEADDHHEHGHVGGEPVDLADRTEQADRGRDGGGAEHEREAGGDERAERDEQDDEHQAVGDELGPLAVLGVLGGDLLGGRGVAELLDADAGMRLLRGGDRGERLLDELLGVLGGARDREVHDDRAAVLGDRVRVRRGIERALDLGDARDRLEAAAPRPSRPR